MKAQFLNSVELTSELRYLGSDDKLSLDQGPAATGFQTSSEDKQDTSQDLLSPLLTLILILIELYSLVEIYGILQYTHRRG